MGHIPGFVHDIFISYAHVDNLSASPEEKKWVDQFHQYLEVHLSKRIGRIGAVKIWRDPNLDGNQLFDKTIKETIDQSALFIALTSNGYLASTYCCNELNWFQKKASEEKCGLVIGDRSRIFNCLLNNIHYTKWPKEFSGTLGFTFNDATRKDQFGEPSLFEDKRFHHQLRELVDAIYPLILEFKQLQLSLNQEIPEEKKADDRESAVIYIAEVVDSLRPLKKRIFNELSPKFNILENIPPPFDADSHNNSVIDAVKKADLCIHLFDEYSGREMDGEPDKTYPQKQVELGLENANAQLIWIPRDLNISNIEDKKYEKFLDQLENGARPKGNYDFIRGISSSLSYEIREKIEQLKEPFVEETPGFIAAALLDTHFKDQLHALELSKYLLERKIQPFVNPQEDDPRKNLSIFKERLNQVAMLIIFYGNVAEEWVRGRLIAAMEIAITSGSPLKACGIYLAPPHKEKREGFFNQEFLKVHMLDNSDTFHPDSLKPLFAGIGREDLV